MMLMVAAPAYPQAPPRPSHPPEVAAELEDARRTCSDAEGKGVTFGKEAVRRLDLTGDGRDDYIVDLNDAECDGASSVYCGTGGCDFVIFVAKPDGTLTRVFAQRALRYDVLPDRGSRRIRFHLHGGFCGRAGAEGCIRTRRISDRPFAFREPQ